MSNDHIIKEKTVVPEWVCEIIEEVAMSNDLTLEQATKLLILHGALFYTQKKEEKSKNA